MSGRAHAEQAAVATGREPGGWDMAVYGHPEDPSWHRPEADSRPQNPKAQSFGSSFVSGLNKFQDSQSAARSTGRRSSDEFLYIEDDEEEGSPSGKPLIARQTRSSAEAFIESAKGPSSSADSQGPSKTFMALLMCVQAIEGADAALLPATLKALERELGLSTLQMGQMALAQSLFCCGIAPIWGYAADRTSRKKLLVIGALGWATCTLMLSMVQSAVMMYPLRCLNGGFLAMLMPVMQTLVADVSMGSLGKRFGYLNFAHALGMCLSNVCATSVSQEVVLGLSGWRFAFGFIAMLSYGLALSLFLFLVEPVRDPTKMKTSGLYEELVMCLRYFRLPSFGLILIQGFFARIPHHSMNFLTLFFQYCRIPDFTASVIVGLTMCGSACGGILGGNIGDRLEKWWPLHGRALTGQLSCALAIPVLVVILTVIPQAPEYATLFMLGSFAFGSVNGWGGPAVVRPLLIEIVDPAARASVLSWTIAIDGSAAAFFGAPVVGFLAEIYGYQKDTRHIDEMPPLEVDTNRGAIQGAMLCCSIPPWVLTILFFGLLHFTLPRDMKNRNKRRNSVSVELAKNPQDLRWQVEGRQNMG